MNVEHKIITYFKTLFTSYSDKVKQSLPQLPSTKSSKVSKIDPKKITELMLNNYTKQLLRELRQELEAAYLREREKESTIKTKHTEQHRQVVQRMHDITDNINIVSNELSNVENQDHHLMSKIKTELKLHPYN